LDYRKGGGRWREKPGGMRGLELVFLGSIIGLYAGLDFVESFTGLLVD
jgi:hypothetical protein